ncbi:transcription termination/antitermination NusG family protein, partial [Candidatus Ventrimonas sp. KK005]
MWYVIQTVTGKELELVHTIRKGVIREKQRQEHCFVLYQECFRRRNGELKKGVELLFPSYVFVETDR